MATADVQGALNIPTKNQLIPKEGPRFIRLAFDFTLNSSWTVDLTNQIQNGELSYIQGLYIDNSQNTNDLIVSVGISTQKINALAGTQGYYPILAPNPPRFEITSAMAANLAEIYFYNVPIAPEIWDASGNRVYNVNDVNLAPAIVNGMLQCQQFVLSGGDLIKPKFFAKQYLTATPNTATNITLATASPSWFISDFDVAISPNATIAGGNTINVALQEGTTSFWSGSVYVPAAAVTTDILPAPRLINKTGININSQAGGNLRWLQSASLATGTFIVNIGFGTTSNQG